LNYTRIIKIDYVESTSQLIFNCSPRRGHPHYESSLRRISISANFQLESPKGAPAF